MATTEEQGVLPVSGLNDIRICDKCNHVRMKTLLPKLQKLDPEATIRVGCKSYCGPCAKRAFVFINGRYVTAPSEDEAVEKARQHVKKKK
ncbi:DUF1450 domain-containing protein [Cohnella nanjingensis]|uniref:DUF1450 domain-containing protein n=1 Tax=Cohnella nanjingensis TaxID=1387779 RepID=A0A7X0VH80_9BACL|nr:DUF1450 domain-containing protein [Cohnella nanjingensis]MBB6673867.1 DUF1450 domain-containing protein [Cohnella nanjingensis]